MSQSDLTISNDTGANVRSDIQAHLQALGSTSLGNSAPSTAYQGQPWLDNNTPSSSVWTLSFYDGSDWIAFAYMDTSANRMWPVSALPLAGSGGVGGAYAMSGDILSQTTTLTPGSSNTTTGYNLSSNGSLHLSNNGSYVGSVNRNSNGTIFAFNLSGTGVGSISVSGSATTYNTSSDYRLKFEVEPIGGAIAEAMVRALRPVSFLFVKEPMGLRRYGYLAHEYAEQIPQGVHGVKDAVDGDGNIIPQGMDATTAVPVLNAALAWAFEKIDALTARIEALEAARV